MNWEQLKTILWLRRRLSRNQFARAGTLGQIVAMVIPVLALVAGCGAFTGGLVGGWLGLGTVSPRIVALVWTTLAGGFLFLWLLGLLTELQQSESLDLQRLMHLPVLLGQVFVLNFIASHAVFSIALFVPAMIGLALGLALSRGPLLLLQVPLALAMVFMVSAWTYCLRGWLAALMTNPRKRRAIVAGITVFMMVLSQWPNLHHQLHRGEARRTSAREPADAPQTARLLQRFVPPFWVAAGAQALAERRAGPALFGTAGCLVLGAIGLARAYRLTVRHYRGEAGAARPTRRPEAPAAEPAERDPRGLLVERRLPGVPEEAAALALASLQSLLRAPEVKLALAGSAILPAIVIGSILFRDAPRGEALPDAAKPFLAAAAAAFAVFMAMQLLSNQFGFDRDGFRTLVLSPAGRRNILLGKNLAHVVFPAATGLLLVIGVSIGLHLSPAIVAALALQLAAMLVVATLGGTLLSILVPYRIRAGSMKAAKMPGKTLLLMIAFQLLMPIVLLPVFVPPLAEYLARLAGLPRAIPLNALLSLVLAGAVAAGYARLLHPLAGLLQRRETRILEAVSADVE